MMKRCFTIIIPVMTVMLCICPALKVNASSGTAVNDILNDEISADTDPADDNSDVTFADIGVSYDPDKELEKRIDEAANEESFRNEIQITDEEMEAALESATNQTYTGKPYKTEYNSSTGLYHYYWSENDGLYMSVPNGAFTGESVSFVVDEETTLLSFTKDGISLLEDREDKEQFVLREPGDYAFMIRTSDANADYRYMGAFHIRVDGIPVSDDCIIAPDGYEISEVYRDGAPLKIYSSHYMMIDGDGAYEVIYRPGPNMKGLPERRTVFVVDTTAPMLDLNGDIENGVFVSDVKYTVSDPLAVMSIYYNGQPAYASEQTLAAAGNYYITVADPYGNERNYSLIVQRHGRIPWAGVGIVLLIFIFLSLLTVALGRRNMRVM